MAGSGWTGGRTASSRTDRGGRKMAICESSTPTSSSREARARAHPPVYISVYKRRNAAGLYKQFDPHRRTCTQRGIFGRFSVLTVSACLLDGPSPLCAPLFPTGPISISNTRAGSTCFGSHVARSARIQLYLVNGCVTSRLASMFLLEHSIYFFG